MCSAEARAMQIEGAALEVRALGRTVRVRVRGCGRGQCRMRAAQWRPAEAGMRRGHAGGQGRHAPLPRLCAGGGAEMALAVARIVRLVDADRAHYGRGSCAAPRGRWSAWPAGGVFARRPRMQAASGDGAIGPARA
ncbi:hypothetical protein DFH09DRAFT_1097115 [Mycena vulgaris]|nr:hypothetical protein DFH09DRAFT_1097115 [Mycena vulgaris]